MFDLDSVPAPQHKIADALFARTRNTTATPAALREIADELFDAKRSPRIPEDMFALSWDERNALRGVVLEIADEIETGREMIDVLLADETCPYSVDEAREIFYLVRVAEDDR